jgi:ElaB/YqjD/DUF883 family membrane-anchored ribosome-binding protein
VTNLKTVAETALELGQEVKESVEEFSRSAGRKLHDAREGTGSALHAAADSVRQGSKAINNVASGTASRLDATASFVEDASLKSLFSGLRKYGRSHLTGSLIAAAAVGFLAGSALSRAARSRT